MEYWSVGVLRQVRIAPRVRGVGDAEGAVDRFAKVNADEERNVHHKHLPPLQGESSFGRVPGVKTPG